MSEWRMVFQCDVCKHVTLNWTKIVCPSCGDVKKIYTEPICAAYGWTPKVARIKSFVLYKPSTWFPWFIGELEFKEDTQ